MSTRATIYVHKIWAKTPTSWVIVKLYQHTDWYIEWLWVNLIRWFQNYRWVWTLDSCIKKSNYCHQNKFEITHGYHWDTEYSYHIYTNRNWNKLKITVQSWFWDRNILNQEETELMRVEKSKDKYGCDTWSIWWLSKLSKYIWEDELYNIKERIEWRYQERFYSDLMFYKRFWIHKVDDFREKVKEEIEAFNQLRANENIKTEDKYKLEDDILLRIKNRIKDQLEIEKHIYFSF